jgi:hypothetical protein
MTLPVINAIINFSTGAGGSAITGYDYYLSSWVNAGISTSPLSLSGLTAGNSYTVYLRPKNTYGVGSQFAASPLDENGAFLGYAIYAPENIAKLEAAFKEEIEKVLKEGFTEKEI